MDPNTLNELLEKFKNEITDNINTEVEKKNFELRELLRDANKKIALQQYKINVLEQEMRKRNLVFYGIFESKNPVVSLEKLLMMVITDTMNVKISPQDIEFVKRLGIKRAKTRPVLAGFVSYKKKLEIMKNRGRLVNTGIFVTDEFPPEIVQKRKNIYSGMMEARKREEFLMMFRESKK